MSAYTSWRALRTKDRLYLVILFVIIICIIFVRYIPFPSLPFSTPSISDTRTLNAVDHNTTINDAEPTPTTAPTFTGSFPKNYTDQPNGSLLYCEQVQIHSPLIQKCTQKDSQNTVLLRKEGTYSGGGVFNHYFNEQLLKPYLPTPNSTLIKFQDDIWYMSNLIQNEISFDQYIINTLSTHLKKDTKDIEAALKIIDTLKGEEIITLLENSASDIGKKSFLTAYPHPISDLDLVRTVYDALINLPEHDPVYQKIRAHYVFLRLFEIGNILTIPKYTVNVTHDNNVSYPSLYYSTIFGSPNGLLSSDQLVLDFYKVQIAENMTSVHLLPKERFFEGKDQRLNLYYNIPYRLVVEQIVKLKENFFRGGLISLSTDTYPETIMVGKDFLNTYLVNFPDPLVAKDRAYERASIIISLIDNIFAQELKDPSTIDPSKPWADINNPAFKKIADHIAVRLAPKQDSYLFNAHLGKYQAPSDVTTRQEEVNDSKRWEEISHSSQN